MIRIRYTGFLATTLAIVWLIARDSLVRPFPVGLFLFGGASLLVLGVVLLELGVARLAGARGPAKRLRWVAAAIACAPAAMLLALPVGWHVVALGLAVAALAVAAIARLAPRLGTPEDPRFWAGTVLAGLQLTALFVAVHLAESTFAVVRPGTERLHALLYFGTWLASLALLLPWGGRVAARVEGAGRASWRWAGLAALIGLVLLEADRRSMLGLYPGVHLWLEVVGVLSLDAAVSRGLASARETRALRRLGMVAGVALLVGAIGFSVVLARGVNDRGLRARISETAIGPALLALDPHGQGRPRKANQTLDYARYHEVPPPANDWNIILLSIDALRADVFAAGDEATPNLSALAASCADFRRAYAPGSRTAIGMGALMLGRFSAHIQWNLWIWDNGLINPDAATGAEIRGLSAGVQYTTVPQIPAEGNLAQRLQAAGLRTLATPWDGYSRFFRPGAGFDPGFDEYADMNRYHWREPASPKVLPLALKQIDRAAGQRFFQWVHLFDPHESGGDRDKYGELVRTMDGAIGEFMAGLEARGLRERTAIVVLADHGEALGDHGNETHGTTLYEEQVRVPMMVCLPGQGGQVFEQPVSTLDATATVLALAGADLRGIDGVNLLPLIDHGEYPEHRPVFTELHRYMSSQAKRTTDLQAVILDQWKLIHDVKHDTLKLFDLTNDPREEASVLDEQRQVASALEELLAALNAEAVAPKAPPPLLAAKPAAFEVTERSALLWARATLGGAKLHFEVATDAKFTHPVATAPVKATEDTDFVHVAEVDDLSPGTRYWYRAVLSHRGTTRTSDAGTFETAAARPAAVRLAWGSGLDVGAAPFEVFRAIRREKPDVLLLLGDLVDVDEVDKKKDLTALRSRHRTIRRDESLQALLATTATAAIWDDGEIGAHADRGHKRIRQARQVFQEQWPARTVDPGGVGLYRSFRPAPQVEVFILDLRSHRDPAIARESMLGPRQRHWLWPAFAESTAKVKIVVSTAPLLAPFGEDGWNDFPAERDELLALLAGESKARVVVLSGDRGLAWHLVDKTGHVDELLAGPLGAPALAETGPEHLPVVTAAGRFALTEGPSFGVLEIAASGAVTARFVDKAGEERHRVVLHDAPGRDNDHGTDRAGERPARADPVNH